MVARLQPVAFWMALHDAPPRSIAPMPALRSVFSGRPRYLPSALALRMPCACASAAVVVVLARHSGEHVQHHAIDRAEHARGELVTGRRQLPAGRQIERDDADLSGVKLAAELEPVARGQTRQPVDLLNQQDIARLAVAQEPKQFGTLRA